MKTIFKFAVILILQLVSSHIYAQFAYSICGRAQAITPWTDIRFVNLIDGSSEVLYAEATKEYELNSLDRNITETVLDAITPMGLGVASCAFDAKRNRLYYSTMEFADLRYFNLDSANPTFTIVQAGLIAGAAMGKSETQFSRMTIAADGMGYMINNDAKQFFRFSSDKKPRIESLGSIENEIPNGDSSKSISTNQGGDIIADDGHHLILVSAMQTVFLIDIETRKAKYIGKIANLPIGYTINGVCVLNQNEIVVSSALSVSGLFKVSINNLQAIPIGGSAPRFTSSDLDNGALLSQEAVQQLLKFAEHVPEIPKIETPKIEEEISLGFYFSQTGKQDIQLVFSKDELGEFKISLSDEKGKLILEQNAEIKSNELLVKLLLKSALPKGIYYLKAKHIQSGHIYLKKLDVNQ